MSAIACVRHMYVSDVAVGFFFYILTIALNPVSIAQSIFGSQQFHYYINSLLRIRVCADGKCYGLACQTFECRPRRFGCINWNSIDFKQVFTLLALFLIQFVQHRTRIGIPDTALIYLVNAIVSLIEFEIHSEISD